MYNAASHKKYYVYLTLKHTTHRDHRTPPPPLGKPSSFCQAYLRQHERFTVFASESLSPSKEGRENCFSGVFWLETLEINPVVSRDANGRDEIVGCNATKDSQTIIINLRFTYGLNKSIFITYLDLKRGRDHSCQKLH
jgi:hypothetical protein